MYCTCACDETACVTHIVTFYHYTELDFFAVVYISCIIILVVYVHFIMVFVEFYPVLTITAFTRTIFV